METAKRKRGRPPKRKAMEFEGMTYEGAINNALDKEVATELDDTFAHKSEDELTDDERKYLKRKREKKSYTLNVRFTESEMQDILSKCEQYGYKNKTEYMLISFHGIVRIRGFLYTVQDTAVPLRKQLCYSQSAVPLRSMLSINGLNTLDTLLFGACKDI